MEAQDGRLLPPQGGSASQAEVTRELEAHQAAGHAHYMLWVTWAICICLIKDIFALFGWLVFDL